MRKITQDASNALKNGGNFKRNNTKVVNIRTWNLETTHMYLHWNCIAEYHKHSNILWLSNCGWETPTTKERLNGILKAFGLGYIKQQNFQWYYVDEMGQEPFNHDGEFDLNCNYEDND